MKRLGYWTSASIARDRERFKKSLPYQADVGDGMPPGMPPEKLGKVIPGDWEDYEINT